MVRSRKQENKKTRKQESKKAKKQENKKARKQGNKRVKKITKKVIGEKLIAKKKIIPVGGMGFANGIMMRTKNFMAMAMKDDSGDIELISFKLRKPKREYKFLSLPFIRGIVLLIDTLLFLFRILFYKRRFIKRQLRAHPRYKRAYIRSYQYVLYIIYFLLFVAFFDYLFLKLHGWPTTDLDLFLYNFTFTFTFLIFFLILFALVAISNKEKLDIFSYHGAEHKIIHTYEHRKRLTIKNVKKESPIHPRCGSIVAFWSLIFLTILLIFFNWKSYNFFLNLVVSVGLLFLAFSFAYELVRFLILRPKSVFFTVLIKPVYLFQQLVVREPTEEQIKVGLVAFKEIMRLEKSKAR